MEHRRDEWEQRCVVERTRREEGDTRREQQRVEERRASRETENTRREQQSTEVRHVVERAPRATRKTKREAAARIDVTRLPRVTFKGHVEEVRCWHVSLSPFMPVFRYVRSALTISRWVRDCFRFSACTNSTRSVSSSG